MSTHHLQKETETAMYRAASRMPPLSHWPAGRTFDIMRSEVCKWMIEQPEIRQTIFNMAKRHGMIVFDLDTKTWRGVRWRE
jgi:hypothetical protein